MGSYHVLEGANATYLNNPKGRHIDPTISIPETSAWATDALAKDHTARAAAEVMNRVCPTGKSTLPATNPKACKAQAGFLTGWAGRNSLASSLPVLFGSSLQPRRGPGGATAGP